MLNERKQKDLKNLSHDSFDRFFEQFNNSEILENFDRQLESDNESSLTQEMLFCIIKDAYISGYLNGASSMNNRQ